MLTVKQKEKSKSLVHCKAGCREERAGYVPSGRKLVLMPDLPVLTQYTCIGWSPTQTDTVQRAAFFRELI